MHRQSMFCPARVKPHDVRPGLTHAWPGVGSVVFNGSGDSRTNSMMSLTCRATEGWWVMSSLLVVPQWVAGAAGQWSGVGMAVG